MNEFKKKLKDEGFWQASDFSGHFKTTVEESQEPVTNCHGLKLEAPDGKMDEEKIQLSTICRQLKLATPDGKMRKTDCANTCLMMTWK